MKEIELTQGYKAMVDDEDFDYLNKFKWTTHKGTSKTPYAKRYVKHRATDGKEGYISMHRFLLNPGKNMFVDHIDMNGLNNQKSNLRICTKSQNNQNKDPRGKSKYLGVSPAKARADGTIPYAAITNKDGKIYFLGLFEYEDDAALAYNKKVLELFGDKARLNVIETPKIEGYI